MPSRQTLLRAAIAASFVTLTLAGCGMMGASSKMQVFEASLSPSQEVPPTASTGSGAAEVQFDQATNKLTWKVTYSGLTGPAAAGHIHGPAAMGANAGVVIPFTGMTRASSGGARATITLDRLAWQAMDQALRVRGRLRW